MQQQELLKIVEGIIFASGYEGVTVKQLCELLQLDEASVLALCHTLEERYRQEASGLQLVHVADAFYMTTKPELAPYLEKIRSSHTTTSLSQAALETLAIIAYRQPITRIDIEEIRGVKSEKPIQTLLNRGLIEEVGRREGVGRPILYGTTKRFLEQFGLNRLEDLPPLDSFQDA
ncbi:MAG: SMC-Scp complex subunit ScpB [Bacillaceae bacterium G1]|nr:SMC-Scp complex subunit ScpB [Bacillota bacterium]OJF17171.1 MAG: SMC-Scp complex subunit ScpB [Bacillaceae bacterium G1]